MHTPAHGPANPRKLEKLLYLSYLDSIDYGCCTKSTSLSPAYSRHRQCLLSRLIPFSQLPSCAILGAYVLHHRQANYRQVVHVDYLDYDYDDYSRFGRVENQLAN